MISDEQNDDGPWLKTTDGSIVFILLGQG